LAAGQKPRPTGRRLPPTKPTPAPLASPAAQPTPVPPVEVSSATLASIDDLNVTAADIQRVVDEAVYGEADLYLRAFYQDREQAIKDARQRALDARLNFMLTAAEAKKRGLTEQEFLNSEINNKIMPPSEGEIRATYDANRAQLGNAELGSVRANIVNYIRSQRSAELYEALVNRLKMTNTVMKNADVNATNLAPGVVLASVNGQPIRVEVINERMKAYAYKMEMRIYAAQKQALNRRVNDLLIVAAAQKRKVGPEEIVRAEITDKIKPITEAEIAKFYEENRSRINGDLSAARAEIAAFLEQQQQEKLETALAEKLRAGSKIQIFLKEPVPPVMNVNLGNGASRGDVNSAVTVVEFTDFQCSACGAMYPVLEDVLKSYGNRIHFVVRNFPLTAAHPNAMNAAQAAAAAKAQGKFWEYIDILFKNQDSLDVDSLKKYATQVGLDRKTFDADFDRGKYEADIRRDIEEGEMYGVDSTPTIYINGVVLTPSEYSAEGIRTALEKAFARAPKRP
jgi:protein-disulfide isomerase